MKFNIFILQNLIKEKMHDTKLYCAFFICEEVKMTRIVFVCDILSFFFLIKENSIF